MSERHYVSPSTRIAQLSNAHKLPGDAPQIRCQRDGCPHWLRPEREGQRYCTLKCGEMAKRMYDVEAARRHRHDMRAHNLELKREREERKAQRIAEARAAGISQHQILARQIDEYWEKQKDPTYYTGIRYRAYSTVVILASVTRARGKSTTTGKRMG